MSAALLTVVEPHTAGDPQSAEKWLNCRLRDIQDCLAAQDHAASLPVIRRLRHRAGYRRRVNHKEWAGPAHPDRDTQFQLLAVQRAAHLNAGQPVIRVDTKKKELIGDFKNQGRCWTRQPEVVNVHDFPADALGRAVPYRIYDLTRNAGRVFVGESAATPQFVVDCIARWWAEELPQHYPQAQCLLIYADGGGSNTARSRVWKAALPEQVADRFGVAVTVGHYPLGCSKWNLIEHRLFSKISKTWARLLSYIEQPRTETGLRVEAARMTTHYPTGGSVSAEI